MWQAIWTWMQPVVWDPTTSIRPLRRKVLQEIELTMRLEPFDWSRLDFAVADLERRMRWEEGFGLDVVDWVLYHYAEHMEMPPDRAAQELNRILRLGGSIWEATPTEEPARWRLTRRALGPVREAIDATLPASQRAHAHLTRAWSKLAGRDPDPSTAYREAIRAVECVAKPIVTPNDSQATLGKMIAAMRQAPHKWTFVLGTDATPVAEMAALVWKSQFDRHGTDDESVPLNVSPEEADAAVHTSIALVRIFAGRLIDTR
jgi:SAM-dependent methyltransferase